MTRRKTYTTNDVMAKKGVSRAVVCRWAVRLGVGVKHGHAWLFTKADVAALVKAIPGVHGNPLMGTKQPASYGRWGKK